MIPLPSAWTLAAALAGVIAGAAMGYALKSRLADGEIARAHRAVAECERAREAQARAAAEEAARRLSASQNAERRALHALHATKTQLAATETRLKEALYALPTAQSCGLSGAARGLLNARLGAADVLPAGAAKPDRAAAEPAADSGVSEAELGAWIAGAITAYDECRARIDAIRAWDEVSHGR